MNITELNREQIVELKQGYLIQQADENGFSPSWGELANADELITDDEVIDFFGSVEFSDDDFAE